jgi:hypothetical protein
MTGISGNLPLGWNWIPAPLKCDGVLIAPLWRFHFPFSVELSVDAFLKLEYGVNRNIFHRYSVSVAEPLILTWEK